MDLNMNSVARVLEAFTEEVGTDVQVTAIMTFLMIAQRGACNQKDIEHDLGISNAAASRNVSYWSDVRFDKKPGLDFIQRTEDKSDRRHKIISLNSKGRAFMERIKNGKATG